MKKIIINLALIFCLYGCSSKLYSQTAIEIKNKLIGTWVLNSSSSVKVVFDVNNIEKIYQDNELKSTYTFIISETCDNETLSNGQFFIKTIAQNNEYVMCDIIEALSEENGVMTLSLTSDGGRHSLFTKQP